MDNKLREELDEMLKKADDVKILPKEFFSEENQSRALVHALSELEAQVSILYRVCARTYDESDPKFRDIASINLKSICDIFGWEDFGEEEE